MKTILTYVDRLMAAVTFAEANEPELAREFAGDNKFPRTSLTQAPKMQDGKLLKNRTAH
ncbi:hypothetical protein [Thiovibrio frasassiensis]|uniref:Uncharacterized protein n=1 Tax=Thiovibrio frasassiensis TaxID=2984131 RepID=A0A9X4MLR6_9BACT|nr:hypothetical protein [Thiovibrio frasassiensis]MDG4475127.1 hypothetical protein [Thiovibrio frasassiensis]